jgi:hypothetical protein
MNKQTRQAPHSLAFTTNATICVLSLLLLVACRKPGRTSQSLVALAADFQTEAKSRVILELEVQ